MTALLAGLAVLLAWPPAWELPAIRVRRRVRPAARRAAERELVEALEAEVRAGRDPAAALVAAASSVSVPVCPHAVAAARTGGDVTAAWALDAGSSDLLRSVSACWSVAAGSGAGLAASLASLAESARERERIRRDPHAAVAEPRATAVVLAALPIVGLGLGAVLGAQPWAWLLGTSWGRLVLVAGLALEGVGAAWAWRITAATAADL